MLTSNELELHSTLTLGTLTTNAEQIRQLVLEKLQDYTPANYEGRVDEAKSDRALLNKAEKALNERRLELEKQYMEPFNKFKTLINETCKAIKQASGGLDEIVKAEEAREQEMKFEEIQNYWNKTEFSLFDISKVYNDKWTNKTTKLKDVYEEIDKIQKKTFDDLKVLDNFPKEDIPLLKTVYLETLDITKAMAQAEQLKQNREKLARENVEREAQRKAAALRNQAQEEAADQRYEERREAAGTDDLAALALGLEINQIKAEEEEEYALVFRGTREKLQMLRNFMTQQEITYDRLENKGNGVYTMETLLVRAG